MKRIMILVVANVVLLGGVAFFASAQAETATPVSEDDGVLLASDDDEFAEEAAVQGKGKGKAKKGGKGFGKGKGKGKGPGPGMKKKKGKKGAEGVVFVDHVPNELASPGMKGKGKGKKGGAGTGCPGKGKGKAAGMAGRGGKKPAPKMNAPGNVTAPGNQAVRFAPALAFHSTDGNSRNAGVPARRHLMRPVGRQGEADALSVSTLLQVH
jgi:hypothetical protein